MAKRKGSNENGHLGTGEQMTDRDKVIPHPADNRGEGEISHTGWQHAFEAPETRGITVRSYLLVNLASLNFLPMMERWLYRERAPETISQLGPMLYRYVPIRLFLRRRRARNMGTTTGAPWSTGGAKVLSGVGRTMAGPWLRHGRPITTRP